MFVVYYLKLYMEKLCFHFNNFRNKKKHVQYNEIQPVSKTERNQPFQTQNSKQEEKKTGQN